MLSKVRGKDGVPYSLPWDLGKELIEVELEGSVVSEGVLHFYGGDQFSHGGAVLALEIKSSLDVKPLFRPPMNLVEVAEYMAYLNSHLLGIGFRDKYVMEALPEENRELYWLLSRYWLHINFGTPFNDKLITEIEELRPPIPPSCREVAEEVAAYIPGSIISKLIKEII